GGVGRKQVRGGGIAQNFQQQIEFVGLQFVEVCQTQALARRKALLRGQEPSRFFFGGRGQFGFFRAPVDDAAQAAGARVGWVLSQAQRDAKRRGIEPACVGRNALRFVFVQRRLVDQEVACGNQSKRGPPEPVSIGVGFGFSEPSSDDAQ